VGSAVPAQWESDGWGTRHSPAGTREGRGWMRPRRVVGVTFFSSFDGAK
jgi:hypothetical protein